MSDTPSYNDRMFAGRLRQLFHEERFRWVANSLREFGLLRPRILEIGCHDGRSIEFLEANGIHPTTYLGLDANVAGGIDIAAKKWADRQELRFQVAWSGADIPATEEKYDVLVSLETLEHMPESTVDDYLARVSTVVDGWVFITVPIERGGLFLLKNLARAIVTDERRSLTIREIWYHTIGKPYLVSHDGHKGFDDRRVVRQVSNHFDIVMVTRIRPPIPFRFIGVQTAIAARSRYSS